MLQPEEKPPLSPSLDLNKETMGASVVRWFLITMMVTGALGTVCICATFEVHNKLMKWWTFFRIGLRRMVRKPKKPTLRSATEDMEQIKAEEMRGGFEEDDEEGDVFKQD